MSLLGPLLTLPGLLENTRHENTWAMDTSLTWRYVRGRKVVMDVRPPTISKQSSLHLPKSKIGRAADHGANFSHWNNHCQGVRRSIPLKGCWLPELVRKRAEFTDRSPELEKSLLRFRERTRIFSPLTSWAKRLLETSRWKKMKGLTSNGCLSSWILSYLY